MQDGVKSQRAYIAGRAESPWREFHPIPSDPDHEQLIYGALGRSEIVTLSEHGETRMVMDTLMREFMRPRSK